VNTKLVTSARTVGRTLWKATVTSLISTNAMIANITANSPTLEIHDRSVSRPFASLFARIPTTTAAIRMNGLASSRTDRRETFTLAPSR
jgi:hypothetical protein